jgi:hypothetical protein
MTGDHILANPDMAKLSTPEVNAEFRKAFPDHVWTGEFPMSHAVVKGLFVEVDIEWDPPRGAKKGTTAKLGVLEQRVRDLEVKAGLHGSDILNMLDDAERLAAILDELRERLTNLERQLGVEPPPLNLRRNGKDDLEGLV